MIYGYIQLTLAILVIGALFDVSGAIRWLKSWSFVSPLDSLRDWCVDNIYAPIANAVNGFFDDITNFRNWAQFYLNYFYAWFNQLHELANGLYNGIRDVAFNWYNAIHDVVIGLYWQIRDIAYNWYGIIHDLAINLYGAIRDLAYNLYAALRDLAYNLYQNILHVAYFWFSVISDIVSRLYNGLVWLVTTAWNGLVWWIETGWSWLLHFIQNPISFFEQFLIKALEGLWYEFSVFIGWLTTRLMNVNVSSIFQR